MGSSLPGLQRAGPSGCCLSVTSLSKAGRWEIGGHGSTAIIFPYVSYGGGGGCHKLNLRHPEEDQGEKELDVNTQPHRRAKLSSLYSG